MHLQRFVLILIMVSSLNINDGINEGIVYIWNSKIEINEKEEIEEMEIDEEEEIIEITKFKSQGLQLKEGILSEEVLRLKSFLKEKGYIDIVDGYYFGDKTRNAIISYQKDKELKPDGIVGENTYNSINQDMELDTINIPQIQLIFTKDVPEEDWIIINKDNNTLYHLHKDEILNRYPVATGKTPSYTPEGKFTIVTKFKDPAWGGAGRNKPIRGGDPKNPLGKRWMGLNIQGGGVYGIHGNSSKGSIGRYISLGCVRMFNEDVENLYDLIDKNTVVWIGSEERLNEYGIIFQYME